jgi:hypothetical protein
MQSSVTKNAVLISSRGWEGKTWQNMEIEAFIINSVSFSYRIGMDMGKTSIFER